MNATKIIRSEIASRTQLDIDELMEDVVSNYMDDKHEIIGTIIKRRNDPELCTKILWELLDDCISETIREAESLLPDDTERRLDARDRSRDMRRELA